jgi:hypothetical protein
MEMITPQQKFYRIRAQSSHGGDVNTDILSLKIAISQSNQTIHKFFNKMVRIVVEQLDIRLFTIPVAPFDGINFILNTSQQNSQVNDYLNPFRNNPDNSVLFLGQGEIQSQMDVTGNFTYRNNNSDQGVTVFLDGSPLEINVADWSGLRATTTASVGLDDANCWWSVLLSVHLIDYAS